MAPPTSSSSAWPFTISTIARARCAKCAVYWPPEVRNTTVDALDRVAYLDYFPAAKAHPAAILPGREQLKACMSAAGLVPALHEILPHEMAPDWNTYCDKVAARAFSDLAAISDQDFESGLAAMRRETRRTGPVVMPMDLFAFRDAA